MAKTNHDWSFLGMAGKTIEVSISAVDLKVAGPNTFSTLSGTVGQQFVPIFLVLLVAGGSVGLNGDCVISVGTAAGVTNIVAAATTIGMTTDMVKNVIVLTGTFPNIPGNTATLDISVVTPDSGTSGTMNAYLYGYLV